MTLADYDAMLALQNGVCAICKSVSDRNLAVDHCHETGTVRGLLCRSCNIGLGNFRDNPHSLRTAADHVEAPRAPDAFEFRPHRRGRRGRPPSS
jgi:hypothetical protein